MLRACRRTLKPGRPTAFITIEQVDGLSPAGRRKAARHGPPSVLTRTGYLSLLASAGFVDCAVEDLTGDYLVTQRAWDDAAERHRHELLALVGEADFADARRNRRLTIDGIEAGLLARRIYYGRRRGST